MLTETEVLGLVLELGPIYAPKATRDLIQENKRYSDGLTLEISSEPKSYSNYYHSIYSNGIVIHVVRYDHYDYYHEDFLELKLSGVKCLENEITFKEELIKRLIALELEFKRNQVKALMYLDLNRLSEDELNDILFKGKVTIEYDRHKNAKIL